MRLSEAILLGSIGTEQGFGKTIDEGKACAAGAAFVAIGILNRDDKYDSRLIAQSFMQLSEYWPWVLRDTICPICKVYNNINYIIAWHLNDSHRWTRPRIAEWVATQEAIYDIQPVEQPIMESTLVTQV